MKNPLVSVIVPCYNAVKYLEKCVASVREQTMPDWELWLVDDCSVDGTYELISRLAQQDRRIRIGRTEKNSGPGPARNVALERAQGKYLLFLDNDDYLERDCLRVLTENIASCRAEVLCYGAYYVYADGRKIAVPNGDGEYAGGWEAIDRLTTTEKGVFSPTIWDSLILRETVEKYHLRFTPTVFEDMLFKYRLLYHTKRIVCLKQYLYNHTLREESLSAAHQFRHVPYYSHIRAVFVLLDYVRDWLSTLQPSDRRREILTYRYFMHFALVWAEKTAQKLGTDFRPLFEEYARQTFGDKDVYFVTLYDLYQLQVKKVAAVDSQRQQDVNLLKFYEGAAPELAQFRRRREIAEAILQSDKSILSSLPHSSWCREFWNLASMTETNPILSSRRRETAAELRRRLVEAIEPSARQKCVLALMLYDDLQTVLPLIEPELWGENLREDFIRFCRNRGLL